MSLEAIISANIDAFSKNLDKAVAASKEFATKVNSSLSGTDKGTSNAIDSAKKMGDAIDKSFYKAEGTIAMTTEEIKRWDEAARKMSMQQYEIDIDASKAEEAAASAKELRLEQDKTSKSAKNLENSYDDLERTMSRAGLAMSAVSVAISAVAYQAISAFGDIQALKLGLTAVAGSTEEANVQFERLTELAKLPGLGLNEVAKATINLQSIGQSAEFAERSIAAFGNAVATVGKGRVEFERAIYGLQQLANTDFPLGEDLNIIKDAIPQVTKLLDEAFGANRSDQLAKMGITSDEVVQTILEGLEKLPPVAGGVNNAFEGMQDAATLAFSRIGEVINERLNFEGLLNTLADTVERVADWFANLDPIIQDVILVIGGLVAAIGPLMLGLSGIIAIAPALGAAFSAMGGVWGLAVAGIIAGIAVLIKNWDRIKAYFTNSDSNFFKNISAWASEMWENIKIIFNQLVSFAKSIWESIYSTAMQIWDAIGSDVMAQVNRIWSAVKSIFNNALTYLNGIFKVFAGLFTGNWDKLWSGLVDVFGSIWNTILDILKLSLGSIAGGLSGLSRALGFDSFANSIDSFAGKLTGSMDKIRVAVTQVEIPAKKVSDSLKEVIDVVEDSKEETTIKPFEPLANGLKQARLEAENLKVSLAGVSQADPSVLGGGVIPVDVKLPTLEVIDHSARQLADRFNSTFSNSISNGIVNTFSSIGESLAGGGNILEAFGQGILATIGDILVQFGKLTVAAGVASTALAQALSNPWNPGNGIAAIAAGAALVAIGSAVKAFSSSLGGGTPGSGGYSNSAVRVSDPVQSSYANSRQEILFRGEFVQHGDDLRAVVSSANTKAGRIR